VADEVEQSWRELEAAVEAFRRIARKAVDVARSPGSTRAQYDDARVQTTFALASIGSRLKQVLHLALGDEGPGSPDAPPPATPSKTR